MAPSSALLAHVSSEPSLSGSHLHGTDPTCLKGTHGGGSTPPLPPALCTLKLGRGLLQHFCCVALTATRHQPPTATSRQPPPTAINHQPTTRPDGPKSGQQWRFRQVVPYPWGGSNGPLWARLGPVLTSAVAIPGTGYRILDSGPPVLRYARRARRTMGPDPVKGDSYQKWPGPLWEGEP